MKPIGRNSNFRSSNPRLANSILFGRLTFLAANTRNLIGPVRASTLTSPVAEMSVSSVACVAARLDSSKSPAAAIVCLPAEREIVEVT